jgi:hypothetical protein
MSICGKRIVFFPLWISGEHLLKECLFRHFTPQIISTLVHGLSVRAGLFASYIWNIIKVGKRPARKHASKKPFTFLMMARASLFL